MTINRISFRGYTIFLHHRELHACNGTTENAKLEMENKGKRPGGGNVRGETSAVDRPRGRTWIIKIVTTSFGKKRMLYTSCTVSQWFPCDRESDGLTEMRQQ